MTLRSASVPEPERLLSLIDAMGDRRVAMLVDLVADRFIHGIPKRISREAPVLILRHEGETLIPGGGANAVANVAALGGLPLPMGIVGDDASGRELVEHFSAQKIPVDGLLVRQGYRTPTKTRVLAGGRHAIKQQLVRFDIEDQLVLSAEERQKLLAVFTAWAPGIEVVVASDYGYGAVDPQFLSELRARLEGPCPILGDSRYRLGEFRGLDGATPNLEEAEALAGRSLDGPLEHLELSGQELRARLGSSFLLITRGSAGMSLVSTDGTAHLPVFGTDQVADVTGAGDTVIGTFALALAAGATPLEAACLANYAGGIVVMKMGTATLEREELCAAVRGDATPLERMRWVAS